jgi:catechol 2,3-dioxygenase-like lactoylglutathione lyase family enzyme
METSHKFRMEGLTLTVADVQRSIAFYRDQLASRLSGMHRRNLRCSALVLAREPLWAFCLGTKPKRRARKCQTPRRHERCTWS